MSQSDLFEDHDKLQASHEELRFDLKEVWTYFLDIFLGKEYILNRSSNILHVLGSVTVSFTRISHFKNVIFII